MKRFSFLAALFAPFAGAQAGVKRYPLPPGSCPVCGYTHPPVVYSLGAAQREFICGPPPTSGIATLAVCRPFTKDNLPKRTQVVCARCRVVFEIDTQITD